MRFCWFSRRKWQNFDQCKSFAEGKAGELCRLIWVFPLPKVTRVIHILRKDMERTPTLYKISLVSELCHLIVQSTEIEDVDQSATTTCGDCVNKRIATRNLKYDFNETFSKIMTKMISQLAENFNGKEDKDHLHQILQSLFHDSKCRSKFIVARASVSNTQECALYFKENKLKLRAQLAMPLTRLRQKGFRGVHTSRDRQN